jgi:nucleotide-binding universal stress UspA family protein
MIERILLPTDGSPLSERAFPVAELIASAQGAEIYAVEVVSPPMWMVDGGGYAGYEGSLSPELYQQLLDELDARAQQDLDHVAQRLQAYSTPIGTHTELLQGSPYGALLDYEQKVKPDLVIMATHGRTGLERFARGSVADCMLREGTTPVLMVRSFEPPVSTLERVLVPLDGSQLAEQALPMVEMLARKPVQAVRLLRVMDSMDDEAGAIVSLRPAASRLEAAGVKVELDVQVGEPGEAIAAVAKDADLIIMATHGSGGWNRFRHGSVAEQTLRETTVPLLLVRARA